MFLPPVPAGKVVRLRGVRGDEDGAALGISRAVSMGEKEKMAVAADSTGPADIGGVAVMVLGKDSSMATGGDRGWAVSGVSGR